MRWFLIVEALATLSFLAGVAGSVQAVGCDEWAGQGTYLAPNTQLYIWGHSDGYSCYFWIRHGYYGAPYAQLSYVPPSNTGCHYAAVGVGGCVPGTLNCLRNEVEFYTGLNYVDQVSLPSQYGLIDSAYRNDGCYHFRAL